MSSSAWGTEQSTRQDLPGAWPAGDFGGHQEKELVGDFKNSGREWRPKGRPQPVRVHDFLIPELGRASPYGVYDLTSNVGCVSVGVDHDTAAFAVQSIRCWWHSMGHASYPHAAQLLTRQPRGCLDRDRGHSRRCRHADPGHLDPLG
jgi:hypothetical protein